MSRSTAPTLSICPVLPAIVRGPFPSWMRRRCTYFVVHVKWGLWPAEPGDRRWRLREKELGHGQVRCVSGVRYALARRRLTGLSLDVPLCCRAGAGRRSGGRRPSGATGPPALAACRVEVRALDMPIPEPAAAQGLLPGQQPPRATVSAEEPALLQGDADPRGVARANGAVDRNGSTVEEGEQGADGVLLPGVTDHNPLGHRTVDLGHD